jgi:predicted component of type VI protein secretion system
VEVKLIVLEGKHKDREIPLPETIFMIGRDKQCHLRPHCASVSKLHCAIAAWAGRVRVRDLKSRNGTYLNGQRIEDEVVVRDGDQLRIGSLVFSFRIKTDDGVPIGAPITSGDVQWLLDSASDSGLLALANQATCETVVPPELLSDTKVKLHDPARQTASMPPATIKNPGNKALFAGEHLQTYFKRGKRCGAAKIGLCRGQRNIPRPKREIRSTKSETNPNVQIKTSKRSPASF